MEFFERALAFSAGGDGGRKSPVLIDVRRGPAIGHVHRLMQIAHQMNHPTHGERLRFGIRRRPHRRDLLRKPVSASPNTARWDVFIARSYQCN